MKRQLVRVLALLVALTCAHDLHADAHARSRNSATITDRVEALAHEASDLVRAGEFHRGIAKYEEAYRIEPAAALLYNIAFIYDRKLDDPRSARVYYERYLLAPDAEPDGSARARDRLADIKAGEAREPAVRPTPAREPTAVHRGSDSEVRFALVEPPRTKTWGWSLLGTGGVALGVGVAFQHMAGLSATQANATQGSDRTILAARVKDQELIGWSVMGLGVASAVTGGLLLLFDDGPDAQATLQVEPLLGPGVSGLSLGSRW
jgi:hypothetical protein